MFSYLVRMFTENLFFIEMFQSLVRFERNLLGNERAGIFGHCERVVVPRLLGHIEDAGNKRFQPTRQLAKSKVFVKTNPTENLQSP